MSSGPTRPTFSVESDTDYGPPSIHLHFGEHTRITIGESVGKLEELIRQLGSIRAEILENYSDQIQL